jgi:hypothetical protein
VTSKVMENARGAAVLYWNKPLDPVDWKHAEQAFWGLASQAAGAPVKAGDCSLLLP